MAVSEIEVTVGTERKLGCKVVLPVSEYDQQTIIEKAREFLSVEEGTLELISSQVNVLTISGRFSVAGFSGAITLHPDTITIVVEVMPEGVSCEEIEWYLSKTLEMIPKKSIEGSSEYAELIGRELKLVCRSVFSITDYNVDDILLAARGVILGNGGTIADDKPGRFGESTRTGTFSVLEFSGTYSISSAAPHTDQGSSLTVMVKERPQSVSCDEIKRYLSAFLQTIPKRSQSAPTKSPKAGFDWKTTGIIAGGCIVILAAEYWYFRRQAGKYIKKKMTRKTR